MGQDEPKPSLDDLETKLREARARRPDRNSEDKRRETGSGLAFALRIGVDIVAALIVGVGIGLLLDHWLGTRPWMLVVFFVLGAAAGMLNVFRAVSGYGYAVGYRKPDKTVNGQKDADRRTGSS